MGFESCHPAVNFLFFAAVLYGSATFTHPVFLAVGWASAFAYSLRRQGGRAAAQNLCLLPLAVVYAFVFAGSHHFGITVLRQNWIGNNMTLESFVWGLGRGLRMVTLVMWLESLFRVVTGDKIVYLFSRVSPFLGLGLTILLRFLPRLGQQARRLHLARGGIGRGAHQGSVLRNSLAIFSALITWMIQALAQQADSLRSRGSLLRGRTAFSIYRFDNRDRGFVVALFTAATLTAMGVILGSTELVCDPRILWHAPNLMDWLSAMGYAALCLLPLALELVTAFRFRQQRRCLPQ